MKNRALAVALTIIIFAGIAACFLRPVPAPNNPDFGNVPEVCRPYNWVEITDCTGDTDLVRATEYYIDGIEGVTVRFDSAIDLLFTTNHYVNGKLIDRSGKQVNYGEVEKLVDGEWVFQGDIKPYFIMIGGPYMQGSPPVPEIYVPFTNDLGDGQRGVFERQVTLYDFDPGATYRMTYYYKPYELEAPVDLFDIAEHGTPEELYSISHTVTIPEATGKRFDVVNPGIREHSPRSDGIRGFSIEPVIRVNDGEPPYTHYAETTFEKLVNGKWVKSIGSDDTFWAEKSRVLGKQDLRQLEVFQRWREDLSNYRNPDPTLRLYISDPSADYRLTLVFYEHPDGSGEQDTLTLNLRFDE